MGGAFAAWQPRYAEYGVATFPVRDKQPSVKGWQRVGLDHSSKLALKFPDAEAFGFLCGHRSGITIVDVDATDEQVVLEAIRIFGTSPLVWRTGGGNHAIAYRHNGERRRIRPLDGLPIDLLGEGGYAVLPPSRGAKRHYEFLSGSIEDFATLPAARPLPATGPRSPDRIPKGRRADMLFNFALEQALHVDDLESLLDVVRTRNMDCEDPLHDSELVKTVNSAWGYEQRGENLKGRGGAMVVSYGVVDLLIGHTDAWRLYGKLRRHNWRREFVLARAMASTMGWGIPRWRRARDVLVAHGIIYCIHRGGNGPGDPPVYAWAKGHAPIPQ